MSDSTNLADCLRNEQSTADDVPKETFCPAKKGDLSALERLYRQYGGSVYGLCLRIIGDPAEAEELTKQAFLKVFRKLHNVRKQSHVDAWLHRFAARIAIKKVRKPPMDLPAEQSNGKCGALITSGTPDLSLLGSLAPSDLDKAADQLPAGFREVFLLHDVQGFDHNAIAEILRCSVQQSKSQLFKARVQLRTLLYEIQGSRVPHQDRKVDTQQTPSLRCCMTVRADAK
jgi:RNA polymerase sigma-70 factor, ECF subfamily